MKSKVINLLEVMIGHPMINNQTALLDMLYQVREYGQIKSTRPWFHDSDCLLTGALNNILEQDKKGTA